MSIESPQRSRVGSQRNRLIAYFVLAVAIRGILFFTLPVFTTYDSRDYILAAEDIYQDLNFLSTSLRDTRLPGYPIVLALIKPVTLMQADRIMVFQALLGIASMSLGLWIGRILGSPLASEVMVVFLGFNPYFLFNEHAIMTEGWYLFVQIAFVALTLLAVRNGFTVMLGIGIGVTAAANVLTRSNVLPFCLTVSTCAVVLRVISDRRNKALSRPVQPYLGPISAIIIMSAVLIMPWLWRNYQMYGVWTFVNYNNRNLLVWKAMHDNIDYSLPKISQINSKLGTERVDFVWLAKTRQVYEANEIEAIAMDLVMEQITSLPLTHIYDIGTALLGFAGIYDVYGDDRTAVRWWFNLIRNQDQINELNAFHYNAIAPRSAYSYTEREVGSLLNDWWSRIAIGYMMVVRPVLLLFFFVMLSSYLIRAKHIITAKPKIYWQTVVILSTGYLVMIALHSVTLTDGDRYALIFDWILVLLIVLMGETIKQRAKGWRQA